MKQPTEADVKKVYEAGCNDIKKVMKTLFPDAFKGEQFSAGDLVSRVGERVPWTVIGYADNLHAKAFYNSLGGTSTTTSATKILVMRPGGILEINEDNGYWILHIKK